MSFLAMAWRYLRFRWLVSLLTVAGISLGVALVCAVLSLRHESERALSREAGLYDLVAGGKGSPLQLVLASVYHLDSPTGKRALRRLRKAPAEFPRSLRQTPVGLGDNYLGYRIVGTEVQFFDLPDRNGEPFFDLGKASFEDRFEVVLGSQVASSSGLGIGDNFFGTHGLVEVPGAEVHRDFPYRVSGILAPTGTVAGSSHFRDPRIGVGNPRDRGPPSFRNSGHRLA